MNDVAPILINGVFRRSHASRSFQAHDPRTGEPIEGRFPISDAFDAEPVLGQDAFDNAGRENEIVAFLLAYADAIERDADALAEIASRETGLPVEPRLRSVEIPRTVKQLRDAASCVLTREWAMPTIDPHVRLASMHGPAGTVVIFGPNNFPFAYNAICGGDFAAAIAAGNRVIAKCHPLQPHTSNHLARLATRALHESKLAASTISLLFDLEPDAGLRLVGDGRVGGVGFTGGRAAGLRLKAAADAAGVPIYLELSSVNPVIALPDAIVDAERFAATFADSALLSAGQFCTNPGLLFLLAGERSERLIASLAARFASHAAEPMLSSATADGLLAAIAGRNAAGAELLVGGTRVGPSQVAPALLRISARQFRADTSLHEEMFGCATLVVVCDDLNELRAALGTLQGQLTASIFTSDGDAYAAIEQVLRPKVGRLLNDKMPTGVTVSPAMMHGGPFPVSGNAAFTAVGMPASIRRFSRLQCYDNVGNDRLPPELRDDNPLGIRRCVDGVWTDARVIRDTASAASSNERKRAE